MKSVQVVESTLRPESVVPVTSQALRSKPTGPTTWVLGRLNEPMAENYDPTQTQVGDNPKHKQLMAWNTTDELGTHQVHYHHGSMGFGTAEHNLTMHDSKDQLVATMGLGHDGEVKHIEVHPELRRQGLATKLYKFGHELHEDIPSIPAPVHSGSRTTEGHAWASSVSNEDSLPKLDHVPAEDYSYRRWGQLKETAIPQLKSHLNEFHAKMIENGMDSKGVADSRYHVDSAHEYLTRAHEMGKDHRNYSDTMNKAHEHIEELGDIHAEWYGNMDDHDALQDHIGRLY